MTKFFVTRTPKGWYRVETRFQRIGTYRTQDAAEKAMRKEECRVDFFAKRKADAGAGADTYHEAMRAIMEAEKAWANLQR